MSSLEPSSSKSPDDSDPFLEAVRAAELQRPEAIALINTVRSSDPSTLDLTLAKLPGMDPEFRQTLREELFAVRRQLSEEIVYTDDYHPVGATRHKDAWQADNSKLTTLTSALESLDHPTGECSELEPKQSLNEIIREGLAANERALIELLKVFTPPDYQLHLLSKEPGVRSLAFSMCSYPFDDEGCAQHFLEALDLERESPGRGVSYIRKHPNQLLDSETEPSSYFLKAIQYCFYKARGLVSSVLSKFKKPSSAFPTSTKRDATPSGSKIFTGSEG